jgi:hypothetical protein
LAAFATKETKRMENILLISTIYNSEPKQPAGKRLRRCKIQTLSARINTVKAGQDFIVTVALYAGRTRVAGDLMHVKDCPNPERAWLVGYYRAQVLAEDYPPNTRLYIANPN